MNESNSQLKDRPYADMDRDNPFTASTDPVATHREQGLEAVRIAHADQLADVARLLNQGQSVLVLCEKSLVEYVEGALERHEQLAPAQRAGRGDAARARWARITHNADPTASVMPRLIESLATCLRDNYSDPTRVAIARHLDLMMYTVDDHPRPEVNDILYWLAEFRSAVKLFFWDPVFTLPAVVQAVFPNRIAIRALRRDALWRLLTGGEARKFSPDPSAFTVAAQAKLYQFVSGINVVELRRIMRSVGERDTSLRDLALRPAGEDGRPAEPTEAIEHVRAFAGIAPPVPRARVSGYDALRNQLEREVVFPIALRREAANDDELRRADGLAQRGVILYGPPGTGKTEWAKWLAHRLETPLFVINGPELKTKFVGDTEAAIRRVIDRARRTAPSAILIDEMDALTAARNEHSSGFENSVVNTLLTEMDGMRVEETVTFIGTTNRLRAIDRGFLRPGRFGLQIRIDYPEDEDRRAILQLYDGLFMLKLKPESISTLVALTAPRPDGAFSGDHLRAVCQFLSRESLYRAEGGGVTDPNDRTFQIEAVDRVRAALVPPRRAAAASGPAGGGEGRRAGAGGSDRW
jgi:cell division protease FtsH